MRIAIVCPYSWSYPGGVTGHVAGLAECLIEGGHEVTVLAPIDPPDRRSVLLHWGSSPQVVNPPPYVVPLGRTVGVRANGAVSNLLVSPWGVFRLMRSLRTGAYDVVHVHEPDAPAVGWAALLGSRSPLVGTFHTYNEHRYSHGLARAFGVRLVLDRLHVRIAVSEAAEWTGRRFFGGRYRVIPNGVSVDSDRVVRQPPHPTGDGLRIAFVGQPVERKGLPVLLRAFEAIRERVPCELALIGPASDDVGPLLVGGDDVRILGKVDDEDKRVELEYADVLCAPSVGGESFGMVLTEAFAAGTPVVASDIPGYREVVRPGIDGLLVPPGNVQALAEALHELWEDPGRRAAMAREAAAGVERFAWPRVAEATLEAYRDAVSMPAPTTAGQRVGVRLGIVPADLQPRIPPRRLPTLASRSVTRRPARGNGVRRAVSVVALLAVGVLCWLAVRKIGVPSVTSALSDTSAAWVVVSLALMSAAMILRAVSWHIALRAALPRVGLRLADAMRGLFIGVLLSSTLPANLGEPSRALVVARRTKRPWENLPVVAGTLMSQSLVNVFAVMALGAVTLGSVDLGSSARYGLVAGAGAAVLVLALVLVAPALLGRAGKDSWLRRIEVVATRVRTGLTVFRRPRLAAGMVGGQMSAWVLQWLAAYVLLVATHLDQRASLLAAAAVLCAVNVTMLLPATPGDVGVFQAAVAGVLHLGWHVNYGSGVAYGVILQAAELLTALLLGVPALIREGLSWRHVPLGAQADFTVTRPRSATGGRVTVPPQ